MSRKKHRPIMEDCYGSSIKQQKKGNVFPTIAESQVSTSTSAVSKPHILLIFKSNDCSLLYFTHRDNRAGCNWIHCWINDNTLRRLYKSLAEAIDHLI